MVQFLDPETAEILQFLDPEIVKMDKKISGSRNRRKGRQILYPRPYYIGWVLHKVSPWRQKINRHILLVQQVGKKLV